MTISYRLASSERPTTSQTVPKLTTPTTSTTLIIRANISRRERNGFTADSVRRGLNTSIRFEVVMYRLRCTGLINDCVRYMGNACHSCLKRRELSLLAEQYMFCNSSIARTLGRVAVYHYRVNSCFWWLSYKHKLEPPLLVPFGLLAPSAPFAKSVLSVLTELSGDVL